MKTKLSISPTKDTARTHLMAVLATLTPLATAVSQPPIAELHTFLLELLDDLAASTENCPRVLFFLDDCCFWQDTDLKREVEEFIADRITGRIIAIS